MDSNWHAILDSPAPPASGAGHAGAFVGRERELRDLMDGLASARSKRGRLFLIGGEAGIGKSRLADELANRAREMGFHILWGRCWEAGGAPAYWPWVQSIRSYLRDREPQFLRSRMGAGVAYLAQLLPEVGELFPDVAPPLSLDSEAARFRLFDAVAAFLRNTAETEPLLLVLDDLHAADIPSLLLLRFLAGELSESSLVVVGLYRYNEVGPDHPIATVLAELGREQRTQNLLLGGLGEADIARFVEISTRVKPHRRLVTTIHRQSEGNALFMGEIVRLLAHEGRLDPAIDDAWNGLHLPPGVRHVIGQRMRHLSAECSRMLALASVLGREFDLAALERMSGLSRAALLQLLEEAESARVVTEIAGTVGRMRFAHALIRDAFYEGLAATSRTRLHQQAGEAIEELCTADRDAHLAELAHHFIEAAPAGEVTKAIAYARAAAARAARLLAFEEAARLYRTAIQVLDLSRSPAPELRCELLLCLGDVHTRGIDLFEGREAFVQAADLARSLGSATHLAVAALGYGGRFVWARSCANPLICSLLREAIAALGTKDSLLRARLLARLAGALRDEPDGTERHALSAEAVEITRRLGDPATLAYALDGRYAATWEPGNARERLTVATELTRIAQLAGDQERALQGHHYRLIALLELGEISAAHAALEAKARIADALQQPAQDWYVQVMRAFLALFEGRMHEADELVHRARPVRPGYWHTGISFAVQLFALRREQARLEEVEPLIRKAVDEYPVFPMFRSILAVVYAELDRREDARRVFEVAAAGDFTDLPWDCQWLFGTTLLAEVACYLGDHPRATTLYRLLAPYAHYNVVAPAEMSTGSVTRSLGLLATALARWEEAERHLQDAISMNERMGARPWAYRARLDYARMLLTRGWPGDREDAREQLGLAQAGCRELGMTALSRRIDELMRELELASPSTAGERAPRSPAVREAPRLQRYTFRREGEYWSVHYSGETFRLKDTKGVRYLARLLAAPSRELHALDLVVAEEGCSEDSQTEAALRAHWLGNAGAVLDARAKAEYRERLEELAEVADVANRGGDFERASQAEQERDFLLRELARAVGLGGRDRRTGSAAERARVNVTRAIKPILKKIQAHHPDLGQHLASTIRTGTFCSYMPDPRVPILWEP